MADPAVSAEWDAPRQISIRIPWYNVIAESRNRLLHDTSGLSRSVTRTNPKYTYEITRSLLLNEIFPLSTLMHKDPLGTRRSRLVTATPAIRVISPRAI